MATKKKAQHERSPVAKAMHKLYTAKTETDKKRESKLRPSKFKYGEEE